MKRNKVSGFTLIELLVVITIIGILAVGGVSVYTQQMAKARDSTRVKDIKALQSAMESIYGDSNAYLTGGTLTGKLVSFMPVFPKDPKSGGANTSALDYLLNVAALNGVDNNGYEISTALENTNDMKLTTDKASGDNNRFEVGNSLSIDTSRATAVPASNVSGDVLSGLTVIKG